MKRQKANSLENITWYESGKQNIQAKRSINGVSVLKKAIHKQQLKETIGHVVQIDVCGFPLKRF